MRVLCNNFNRRTEGGRIPLARPARSIDRAHIPLALKARPFASQSVTATTFAALRLLPQLQLVSFDSLGSHLANRYLAAARLSRSPHSLHSASQLSVVYVARSPPAPFSFQFFSFQLSATYVVRPTKFYFVSGVRGPSALRQKCRRGALRPSRTCPCYTPRGAGHDRSRPLGTAESSTGAPWLPSVSSRRCSGLD